MRGTHLLLPSSVFSIDATCSEIFRIERRKKLLKGSPSQELSDSIFSLLPLRCALVAFMLLFLERKLLLFETADNRCPFLDWLLNLKDLKGRAIIRARLERIKLGNLGDCKGLGVGISELRISFGPGYRVYFGRQDTIIVLLCGGDKSSQKRDIVKA